MFWTVFALHVHTIVMDNTQRNAHDAAFTLKEINFAVQEGNVAAAHKFGINGETVETAATLQLCYCRV